MEMQTRISLAEGAALHGLLEEANGDIIVRVDSLGFIETASSNIGEMGYDLTQLLFKPHLADLALPDHSAELKAHVDLVLAGSDLESGSANWLEFPVRRVDPQDDGDAVQPAPPPTSWYALSLRALCDDEGGVTGAIGLLRSVDRKRALEGEVHARSLVDPLTGLANRHAFCAALRRQLSCGSQGALAMFEIDRMRAVFMQYGQRTADEIVWGFARFLETMVAGEHDLAQLGSERFCVILAGLSHKASRRWTQDVLGTFASLTLTTSARAPRLSASAGLTPLRGSVDEILRQAEVAMVMARARGGMQVVESSTPFSEASRIAL